MKIINIKIIAVVLLALFASITTTSQINSANAFEGQNTPLLVIRFNQARINYNDQLFFAATEAVKTKPSVIFDVVAYAPTSSNKAKNTKYRENAQFYGRRIANDLVKMGVNQAQVTVKTQTDGSLKNEEVKIFVR